jgi:GNAT superfamily N-acetyltransferase
LEGDNGMSALLSPDFQGILDVATVNDVFSFNGRCGDYDPYLEEPYDPARVIWSDGEYSISDAPDTDEPTVILFHGGAAVGFYGDLQCWVDEEHRGRGLGARMIVAFADRNGPDAFRQLRRRAGCAMGFSAAGYAAHAKAKEMALSNTLIPALGVLK